MKMNNIVNSEQLTKLERRKTAVVMIDAKVLPSVQSALPVFNSYHLHNPHTSLLYSMDGEAHT